MTWKSKFNWQKLSSLKAVSVTVPQSLFPFHSSRQQSIHYEKVYAPFWSILQLQRHENFSHLSHPLPPVATGLGKCMNLPNLPPKSKFIDTSETGCNYNRSWRLICFHQAVVSTFRLTLTVAHTIHAGAKEGYHVIFNRLLTRLNVMFCLFSTGRNHLT